MSKIMTIYEKEEIRKQQIANERRIKRIKMISKLNKEVK
jgi:hypothetical protein